MGNGSRISTVLVLTLFLGANSYSSLLFSNSDTDNNHRLSPDEFSHIYMQFDTWPQDQSISEHEFMTGWKNNAMHHLGLTTERDAVLFFFSTDINHDMAITSADVNALFKLFDKNGNGSIDSNEFQDVWRGLYN